MATSPESGDDTGGPWSMARSKSFASDVSAFSDSSRLSWQGSDVLGTNSQGGRSPRQQRRTMVQSAGVKVPKQPRFQRATVMTDALIRGVRESISLEQTEVQLLRDSLESASLQSVQSQGRLYEMERRLRFTERYVKRLECHLAEIEELSEEYNKQQKLREATERLAAAYSTSGTSQSQRGLSQARSGFKECTEEMCIIEAQMENKMGTLLFELKGIQGFARLCVGDVYEIGVRLGAGQDWRSRATVAADHVQRWSRPRRVLRPSLSDQLVIKASEVKTLGKQVLGTKLIETAELLSAETQQMVLHLNSTGSLKMTLIVTWSPLESFPEDTLTRQPSSASSPNVRRRQTINSPRLSTDGRRSANSQYSGGTGDTLLPANTSSSPALSKSSSSSSRLDSDTPDILRKLGNSRTTGSNRDSYSSGDSVDAALSEVAAETAAYTLQKRPEIRSDWFATAERRSKARRQAQTAGSESPSLPSPRITTTSPSPSPVPSGGGGGGAPLWTVERALRPTLASLSSLLDEAGALLSAAQPLRWAVEQMRERCRWSETAQHQVDATLDGLTFLEVEETSSKPDLLEPGMTARTSDSGISSIVHQLSCSDDLAEAEQPPDGGGAAPHERLSETGDSVCELTAEEAGNRHKDECIKMHLEYCVALLNGAESSSPLHHRADRCQQRLTRQAALLTLVETADSTDNLLTDPEMQEVWQSLCGRGAEDEMLYHIGAGSACQSLTDLLKPRLEYKDPLIASKVSRLLIGRCLDVAEFSPNQRLTVLAFRDFTENSRLHSILEELAEEAELSDTLLSHNAESIQRRLGQLVYMFPPRPCLRPICHLLAAAGTRVVDTVRQWLRDVATAGCLTNQLTEAFTELLEAESALEREGAARALHALRAWTDRADLLQRVIAAETEPRVRTALQASLPASNSCSALPTVISDKSVQS